MVMRIKFVKELNKETGLMTTANEPFLPNINNLIYTVTVDSKNFVHFFIGSTEVAGGLQDALMKLIAAGHAHLVSKSNWDRKGPSNCNGGGFFFTRRELMEELFT